MHFIRRWIRLTLLRFEAAFVFIAVALMSSVIQKFPLARLQAAVSSSSGLRYVSLVSALHGGGTVADDSRCCCPVMNSIRPTYETSWELRA
jgi:hypothetical protein